MFNPLLESITDMNDDQLQARIRDVTRKYYLTNNDNIKQQLRIILDQFVNEQTRRITESKDGSETNFDDLISVN